MTFNEKEPKTYRGTNANEALMKVELDLGDNARILEKREVKQGGIFGFFSQTLVEVDAYLPESEQALEQANGFKPSPSKKWSAPEKNGLSQKKSPVSSRPESLGNNEWRSDEPAMPNFSTREHAANVIREKSSEISNGSHGNNVYSRPRSKKRKNHRTSNGRNGSGGPSAVDNRTVKQLMENTDLVSEKLDRLLGSIEHQNRSESMEPKYPDGLGTLYKRLIRADVQKKYARNLVNRVRRQLEPTELGEMEIIYDQVERELGEDFRPAPSMTVEKGETKIMPFIGPTGVGKTTTLAKLASYFSLEENFSVGVITLDTFRIAATDQLSKYARILHIPFKAVIDGNELEEAINEFSEQNVDLIFLDTAGRSQFDTKNLKELDGLFPEDLDVITHLTISATSRMKDVKRILEGFETVGYDRIVITKLDETDAHGSIYNLMQITDKPMAYFTHGQEVPGDLCVAEARKVADLLTGRDE